MTTFYVRVYEESICTYKVEADTAEEAEENYWEYDIVSNKFVGSEVTQVSEEE